jgi:hypothetical protein
MSHENACAKQTQDRSDRFNHLTHPFLRLTTIIADEGFRTVSSVPENGFVEIPFRRRQSLTPPFCLINGEPSSQKNDAETQIVARERQADPARDDNRLEGLRFRLVHTRTNFLCLQHAFCELQSPKNSIENVLVRSILKQGL